MLRTTLFALTIALSVVGCQSAPSPEPPQAASTTTADGYQITIRVDPHMLPDGREGSKLTVSVTPPNDSDEARMQAQRIGEDFLRRYQEVQEKVRGTEL